MNLPAVVRPWAVVGMCLLLFGGLTLPALAQADEGSPLRPLAEVERLLYGEVSVGPLAERVARVEKDLYGSVQRGALVVRIATIREFLASTGREGGSLTLQLNALEWFVLHNVSSQQPLVRRVRELEGILLGRVQDNQALVQRIDQLVRTVWPDGRVQTVEMQVPATTLVKIRLLTRLDSATSEVGNPVRYEIAEDVRVDGRLVIPRGQRGEGVVSEVTRAGVLGRNGRVRVNFKSVEALDGTPVPLQVAERSTRENMRQELAIGAGLAGVILLANPIGAAGALLVKGENVVIPAGTEFFVEVAQDTRVHGLVFRP